MKVIESALRRVVSGVVLIALAAAAACGDSVSPNIPREEVAGGYVLAELAFDPQGSLPVVDLIARLETLNKAEASLVLTTDGHLQLLFEDPGADLLRLVQGSFRTTPAGVFLDFGGNTQYRALLLSQQLTFTREMDGSLVFDADAPSGASRTALVTLVPEWQNEPTVDPMPGMLRVVFQPVE